MGIGVSNVVKVSSIGISIGIAIINVVNVISGISAITVGTITLTTIVLRMWTTEGDQQRVRVHSRTGVDSGKDAVVMKENGQSAHIPISADFNASQCRTSPDIV
ncbi:hypothetical protein BC829DRAFT_447962 [Chytridium lagenaria]|nr:hypothetical protein BC829DRAFT_447962 [Chytridium lagenaria]